MATELLSSGFGSASGVLSSILVLSWDRAARATGKSPGKVCLERVLVKTQECSCGERGGRSPKKRTVSCGWAGRAGRTCPGPGEGGRETPCGQPAVLRPMVMLGCSAVARAVCCGRGGGQLGARATEPGQKSQEWEAGQRLQGESTGLSWFSQVKGRTRRLEEFQPAWRDAVSTPTRMEKSERVKKSGFEPTGTEGWCTLSGHQKVRVELRMEGVLSHLQGSQVTQRF